MKKQRSNRRHEATKKGYTLPEIVDPPETLCVCVPVPDEIHHRAAFLGQIYALSRAFTWGNDAAHTAIDVANVWDNIFWIVRDQMALQPRHCGCPDENALYRFTEDGVLEKSLDGGTTWNPAPLDDPRLTAPLFPPLPGSPGTAKKCESANNAAGQIRQAADQLIADSGAWSSITLLIGAVLSILAYLAIFGSAGLLTPLVVGLAGVLLGTGSAAFAAAMTSDVYERLVCAFYCNMQEDGSFTAENIDGIKASLAATEGGVAFQYLLQTVGMLGAVGLTNMGRTTGASIGYDCEECACPGGCAEKYQIWTQSAGSWGVIVASGDNWFDVEIAASGFALVEAIDGEDCCEGLTVETISGSGTQSAYLSCGTVWTPGMAFISATIVNHCINAIEYQGTPGTIIRTTLTPCA